MIIPRFTVRTAFVGVTVCALAFVVIGMAYRGESWAWGITIGLISLVVTMLVHAAWFGIVSMFARLPAAPPTAPAHALATAAANVRPSEAAVESTENRGEAKP